MVGVTKIQRGNANYWLSAVAQGGEDYYTKPGEAPGEWLGEIADMLGLAGQVDPAGYGAILEGRDPSTEAILLERPETSFRERADGSQQKIEPVLGYDVRFSAPKSVSLLYAFGSERTKERIVAVMNEAVRQGIEHLENEACKVQRGKGGVEIEPGAGFVGMAFRHRMSRAGDPALHVHVLISNLTRAVSDGNWMSLASPQGRSPIYAHAKSAGVIFQAALRAGFLREFGLEFGAVRNGYADLQGFSRELIEAFSTRSREIRDWMKEHGVSSVAAAQTAAYRTRAAKDYDVDADQRVTEWEAQAEPFGFSRFSAEQMVAEASPREPRGVEAADLRAAVEQLQAERPHFDGREALWAIADQLPEGADLSALTSAQSGLLKGGLVVRIHKSLGPLDPHAYSTPLIVNTEHGFIKAAREEASAGVGIVGRPALDRVLARHDYLGADQREMVLRLTSGGERVIAVAARPGTGKTTALEAAAQAWKEAGYPVIGCATARVATGELKDAGIQPHMTIKKLRFQVKRLRTRGRRLPDRVVIVVDEANVTDSFDLKWLLDRAVEVGGKLVLIGDPRQIGAIGPGGLFANLTRITDPVRLTTIRRQRGDVDRRLVNLVHEARGSEALDLLRTQGKLVVGDNIVEVLHGLVLDWYRDYATGADAVMIARRNRDVDYMNDRAREILREQGKLGRLQVRVGERAISRGDRVLTRINTREVDNRERWDVISVNPITRSVRLRRVGGDERVVTLHRDYLQQTTPDEEPALQYAYAITKFGAEAKTFDRAYPLLDHVGDLNEELVALSRGREVANVYAVASSELLDPELGPARREVTDVLQDVRASIEHEGADFAAFEVSLRRRIDDLSPAQLAKRRAELAEEGRAADPAALRRKRLDAEIARDRSSLQKLARDREDVERLPDPPSGEIARLAATETSAADRMQLNIGERESLPDPAPVDPTPLNAADRLEAVLIAERIERDVSRAAAVARAGDSEVIFASLGSYPDAPELATEWDGAAHAILSYRLRHDVPNSPDPLGKKPKSAAARVERARVEARVSAARRRLEIAHDHGLQRNGDLSIGR